MHYYTRYNPPPSPSAIIGGKSMTHQEFAPECDINNIVARVGLGQLSLNLPQGEFVDFSSIPSDYQAMLDCVIDAQERFANLPSAVRKRFANNPAELLKFIQDDGNRDEAIKLGLIAPAKDVSIDINDKGTKDSPADQDNK